jgi:hypothetical protein
MRKLFGSPRAGRLDALADRIARGAPPLELGTAPGVIADPVDGMLADLRRDGLVVLESRLSEERCAALERLARETSCVLIGGESTDGPRLRYDAASPVAVRYDVPEGDLLASEVVQELLADRSILRVAQAYLGSAPVQDLVAMWWTAASTTSSSPAAQQFHFDLDRLRFLKLFVYLTDVGPDTGPHVYVRGSHRFLPAELRADRRFGDDEVLRHYGHDRVASVTGPRGTMFLADTRGLHKGTPVIRGERLVFQLEYTSSLFGAPAPTADLPPRAPALRSAIAELPSTYRRFDV